MKDSPSRLRNTSFVIQKAQPWIDDALRSGLMHTSIQTRRGKTVLLPDGRNVVEFVNCSYLGLDQDPRLIEAAKAVLDQWGVHFCCARSRFSIQPHRDLEDGLSSLWKARAITFPSVTAAHLSVLPLLASGSLFPSPQPARLIFDRFAHASMQSLKPILAAEATLVTIPHNDLQALSDQIRLAHADHQTPVYIADGVYSMGGHCPILSLLPMVEQDGLFLYIDDAHGTSIFGDRGEGYILSQIDGPLPEGILLNFSLAKGFGCNGGGVLVPSGPLEETIRAFGQTYIFSAPLDFSLIGAALACLELHKDGTIRSLQARLRSRIELFHHSLASPLSPETHPYLLQSPLYTHFVGHETDALALGRAMIDAGFFASVAFFPVVAQDHALLRIALTVAHSEAEIRALAGFLRDRSL